MRDYHKGMTITVTTDFSLTAMDARTPVNHKFQVLRETTCLQESYPPQN